jgi:hypothetical protein
MSRDGDPRTDLEHFLADAFNNRELTLFANGLRDGESLVRALPEHASPAERAHALVSALLRRGPLDQYFFTALRTARSRKLDAIDTLERRLHERPPATNDDDELRKYRDALVARFERIEIPGTCISGPVERLFRRPRLTTTGVRRTAPHEDDLNADEASEEVDLDDYLEGSGGKAVIVASAGHGKSTLLRALAHHKASSEWLPVFVPLAHLATTDASVLEYLNEHVNQTLAIEISWLSPCESGQALLLFDGLDELSTPDRSRVRERIEAFSSRFPKARWLLTVREAGALAPPRGAPVLTLQALAPGEIDAFARAYLAASPGRADANKFCQEVAQHSLLRRLARVPLFLALLVSHAIRHPDRPLPRRRSELLEEYLEVLLDTERRNPPLHLRTPRDRLRDVAEQLAFAALEQESLEIATQDVLRALRISHHEHPDEVLADLETSGLLRRLPPRVGFVFPSLQEYLAGCHVARHHPNQIRSRFEQTTSRPWAQALPFALEKVRDPDEVICELLALPDDAFATNLRVIGRCVANGASVTATVRRDIGERLATVWIESGKLMSRCHDSVGEILAEGFASPLPDHVRTRLAGGYIVHGNSGAILTAAQDDDLTRIALVHSLDAIPHYYLRDAQRAVDRIAADAFDIYLDFVRSAEDVEAVAYLIEALPGDAISPAKRAAAATDATLPDDVRLAVYMLASPLDPAAIPLIDRTVRSPADPERNSLISPLVRRAIARLDRPADLVRRYLCDPDITNARKRLLLFDTIKHTPPERVEAELGGLLADLTGDDFLVHSGLLTLAALGHEDAMRELTAMLATMPLADVTLWIWIANRYRCGDLVLEGLRTLTQRSPWDRRTIVSDLVFAMRFRIELDEFDGSATGTARTRHPAIAEAGRIVVDWADHAESGSLDRLRLLMSAVELDRQAAAPALRRELEPWRVVPPEDEWENSNILCTALEVLAATPSRLSPEQLLPWASVALPNMPNTIIRLLGDHALQDEALTCLLALQHCLDEPWLLGMLSDTLERLAQRMNLRIVRDERGHLVPAS